MLYPKIKGEKICDAFKSLLSLMSTLVKGFQVIIPILSTVHVTAQTQKEIPNRSFATHNPQQKAHFSPKHTSSNIQMRPHSTMGLRWMRRSSACMVRVRKGYYKAHREQKQRRRHRASCRENGFAAEKRHKTQPTARRRIAWQTWGNPPRGFRSPGR